MRTPDVRPGIPKMERDNILFHLEFPPPALTNSCREHGKGFRVQVKWAGIEIGGDCGAFIAPVILVQAESRRETRDP